MEWILGKNLKSWYTQSFRALFDAIGSVMGSKRRTKICMAIVHHTDAERELS